ncbi:hypothetical protein MIND_00946200 [Mycena indigotica]|uniref:Uncharacterized protein n=1 Tax=Mycena indigotica TaxID=2126181 RepID=A0A8H6SCW0_9AGAR|nr:uncharacterized protein MIND_00946200 [Mycena indigotica]KAF7297133.1 hypothetical protein MIND_00946200 [Mycena indigotica]
MPQPILKRGQTTRAPPAHPPLLPHNVHFPSSPSLARTFATHSSTQYDRSPIEVSPNACELPARGCPGRTYYDGSKPKSGNSHNPLITGKALHPRAIAAYDAQWTHEDGEDDNDETELERTPTRTSPYIPLPVQPPIPSPYYSMSPATTPNFHSHLPPPLIPDLSSSSDESDGFASPPPEPAIGYYGSKYSYFGYPNAPPPSQFYPPPISPPPSSSPPSSDRKRRSRRSSPRRQVIEDGYEEEDLPGSYSHAGAFSARMPSISPPRDRSMRKSKDKEARSKKEKCTVSSLCRSLAGTSFRDGESEGCLGGF